MSDIRSNKIFIVKINPARKSAAYLIATVMTVLFLLTTIGQEPIRKHFDGVREARMVDEMRPVMKKLADEGKPAAVVWMFKHDYEGAKFSGFEALADAALTGDPESMWAYGVVQIDLGRIAVAEAWIAKAADAGYPDAVKYMQIAAERSR